MDRYIYLTCTKNRKTIYVAVEPDLHDKVVHHLLYLDFNLESMAKDDFQRLHNKNGEECYTIDKAADISKIK